jgi:hypothetical protein
MESLPCGSGRELRSFCAWRSLAVGFCFWMIALWNSEKAAAGVTERQVPVVTRVALLVAARTTFLRR